MRTTSYRRISRDTDEKVYINVTKYANEHNLSLAQAHNEIQPFLFNLGYNWACKGYHDKVVPTFAEYLEMHREKDWVIHSAK